MNLSNGAGRERAWVEVNLEALCDNARTVARTSKVPLLAMVKTDGYGLGMVAAARALESIDPWGFGVATPEEGTRLREAGITRPIVVFTPAATTWFELCRGHELDPVLGNARAIDAWQATGGGRFHIEVDTGMSRSGIPWRQAGEVLTDRRLSGCVSVFTHFACAEDSSGATAEQRQRFETALHELRVRPEFVHAANSGAIFRGPDYAYDMVRPGVFLYGGRPGAHAPQPRTVANFRARVVHAARLKAGDPVSYGWRWRAQRPTTIATLAAGFADGVPRSISGRGAVMLRGARRPIVGAVNMDVTLVEVETGEVTPGDIATFFGDEISVDEWAGWALTTVWEALTRLGPRVVREYV